MSQSQLIQAIICKGRDVEVDGGTIHLETPGGVEAALARAEAYTVASSAEGNEQVEAAYRLAHKSLCACLPEEAENDVWRLMMATGGAFSELADAAQSLCGMNVTDETAEDGQQDPPT